MSDSDKMSIKSFMETVEEKLDSLNAMQLRLILTDMALQTPSEERREFLDKLIPPEDEVTKERRTIYQENLLNDIQDFMEELEGMMEEDAEEYYEERHWDDWYDEGDASDFYEDYINEMENLLDRTNAVFDNGNLELARDAYNKLFAVFRMEDDYGGGIGPDDFDGLDMKEVAVRYLRSIYETTSSETRPQSLFGEMMTVSRMGRHWRISLEDLIQVSTRPLPDREQFISDWISFLREEDDRAADYWLREAVRVSKGTAGLEELAISDGEKRPRAFLEWIAALMYEEKYPDVIVAVEQARKVIKPDMPIRAAIADLLREAAEHLGDAELASAALWEAFYAKPELNRLLNIWESASDSSHRIKLMQAVSERVKVYLSQKRPMIQDYYSLDSDDAEMYAYVAGSTLAHAYLLAEDWKSAYEISFKQEELGWSNSENSQGLTVACFLGLATGKMPSDFPPNLSLLWDTALENSIRFSDNEVVLSRLKNAYSEMLSNASLGSKEEDLLDWCLSISRKRAIAIVSNQYRKSYWKAATLITACAEVLNILGGSQESQAIIAEIRSQFPRHRSFQAEMNEANARRK